MKTYPYQTPEGIMHLVGKRGIDKLKAVNAELIERLRERTESHLAASARDVQTIQRQSVMLEKFAKALGRCTFRDWFASDDTGEVIVALDAGEVRSALSAYKSANFESVTNPIDEAVKRMEEVPMYELDEIWFTKTGLEWDFDDALERIRARLISAAKGEQP